MKHIVRNICIFVCAVVLLISAYWGVYSHHRQTESYYEQQPLQTLTVSVLDVGKGDAILIACGSQNMIVDTGYNKTYSVLKNALEDAGITSVDTLVLTHFDKDHIGGADKLLADFSVSSIYTPDYTKDSKQFDQLQEQLGDVSISSLALKEEIEFALGDAQVSIYPPLSDQYENSNDYSLCVTIEHGADRYLFPGDAEDTRLQELMGQIPLDYTFLKVPHHGRYANSSEAFFKSIEPKYAVITCSEEEQPDPEILDILKELGTETMLTSDGTIVISGTGSGTLTMTQNS